MTKIRSSIERHISFHITPSILHLSHQIDLTCRYLYPLMRKELKSKLIKDAKIKIINSFLSMESNKLNASEEEIENISHICKQVNHWDPLSIRNFKQAHRILMNGLDKNKGRWRKYEVVVFEGRKVVHTPPPPKEIEKLMKNLFNYIKKNRTLSWAIKSCIIHYGIQYIHPFMDGNGRMGRIWQHCFLLQMSPVFRYILIGNIIQKHSVAYYHSLDKSDLQKNGAIFIEFCLKKIMIELKKLAKRMNVSFG